ncbi:hypothetical protein CFC21_021685, partial [Triticum aestivum]
KYIASMHATNHVNLINNISSKDNYYQNHTTEKFHYIYFNNDCSESAFLAAGFVIEVANKVATHEFTSAISLVRPPVHHVEHKQPTGFCFFNNVAIVANYILN